MKANVQAKLNTMAVVGILSATIGGLWEGFWWHEYIAYELWGAPPHVLQYGFLVMTIVAAIVLFIATRSVLVGAFIIVLALIPLNIYLHMLWNTYFGVPSRASYCVYYCPQHLFPLLEYIVAPLLLMASMQRSYWLQRGVLLALVITVALQALRPLRPIVSHDLSINIIGAFIIAFVIITGLMVSKKLLNVSWGAVYVAMYIVIIRMITGILGMLSILFLQKDILEPMQRVLGGFSQPPAWILALSILCIAYLIDAYDIITAKRALAIGLFFGSIRYVLSMPFLDPSVDALFLENFLYVISAGVGGIVAYALSTSIHLPSRTL